MGILKFIFIIFLGLFSLGEVIRFDFGNSISIKPVDIAAAILLLTWIIKNPKNFAKDIRSDNLFIPIISVVVIICVSILVNFKNFSGNEILVALSYIARWILYASLFFIVKSFPSQFKRKILYLLLMVGGFFTLFGFAQYFFYSNLKNLYYLGWDEHMHRMFSTFLDPNFAGAFFVLILVFLSGIMYFFENNRMRYVWFVRLIWVFSLASVFLTYSRSALIMLVVSTVIFSILTKKLKLILGLILVAVIFIFISSRSFNIENVNLFRMASTEARLDSAKIAIQIIRDNPIFGVGFNTYRYAQIKYGFRNRINSNLSHADAGTDNSFLFVFATTGIVGLIIYLNMLLAFLKRTYKNYKKCKDKEIQKYIGIILISSIGGIIIDSFFINSLFYSFIMIWMWVLLGLTESN